VRFSFIGNHSFFLFVAILLSKAGREANQGKREQIQTIFKAALMRYVIDDKGKIMKWNSCRIFFGWTTGGTWQTLTETIIPKRYREAHQKEWNII